MAGRADVGVVDAPEVAITTTVSGLTLANGHDDHATVPSTALPLEPPEAGPSSPSRVASPAASLPDTMRTPRFTLLKRPSTSPEPGHPRSHHSAAGATLEAGSVPSATDRLASRSPSPAVDRTVQSVGEPELRFGIDKAIVEAIAKGTVQDKQVLLLTEAEMSRFVVSGITRSQAAPNLNMTSLNSYQRLLVHRLGDAFGVRRTVDGGQLVLERTPSSALPKYQLARLLKLDEHDEDRSTEAQAAPAPVLPRSLSPPRDAAGEDTIRSIAPPTASDGPAPAPKPIKIMSRTSSDRSVPRNSVAPSPVSGSTSDGDASAKSAKTKELLSLEARQLAYNKARERIFAASKEPSTSSQEDAMAAKASKQVKRSASPIDDSGASVWSRNLPEAGEPGPARLRVNATSFDPSATALGYQPLGPFGRAMVPDFRRSPAVAPTHQGHLPQQPMTVAPARPVIAAPVPEYPAPPAQHFATPRYETGPYSSGGFPQSYVQNGAPLAPQTASQYHYPTIPMHHSVPQAAHPGAGSSFATPFPPSSAPYYGPPAPPHAPTGYPQQAQPPMQPPSIPSGRPHNGRTGNPTYLRPYIADALQPAPYAHVDPSMAVPPANQQVDLSQHAGWPTWYEPSDSQRHDPSRGTSGILHDQRSYLSTPSEAGSDLGRPALRQSIGSTSSTSSLAYVPHRPASALSSSSGSSVLTASSSFSKGRGPPTSVDNQHHARSLRQTSYPMLSSQAVARLSPESSRNYLSGSAGGSSSRSSQNGVEAVSVVSTHAPDGGRTSRQTSSNGGGSRTGSELDGPAGGVQASAASMQHPLPPKPTWAVHPAAHRPRPELNAQAVEERQGRT